MKPMIPSVGGQSEPNLLNDMDVKSATKELFNAAKDRMQAETTATVLEKVLAGGSGKTKDSLDLTGIGNLLGGVSEAMQGTNNFLLTLMNNLLSKKENGSTDNTLMMLILIMLMQQQQQPQQGTQFLAQLMAQQQQTFAQILEQVNLRFTDIVNLMNRHHEEKVKDLEKRIGPDPVTDQIYNQVLPTIVNQAIGQAKKDPLDQLAELKEKLDRIGGTFNLFGGGNSLEEKIKLRTLDLEEAKLRSEERKHAREWQAKHEAPKKWGEALGSIFSGFVGNQSMTPDFLFGGGQGGQQQTGQAQAPPTGAEGTPLWAPGEPAGEGLA